jgi:uncharacterized protein
LKIENQYIIHFKGLKEGVHYFSFSIDKKFFEAFEHLEIPDGSLEAKVDLTRKVNFLELHVTLSGEVQVHCDRCLEYFGLPVSYTGSLLVKFSETEKDQQEDIIFLHPDDYQLDLKHYLYECVCLSIPLRKVHPDLSDGTAGCDNEMLKKLNDLLIQE